MPAPGAHVVVVGGGLGGLAAALALSTDAPAGTRVTICEAAPELGGKLKTSEVAGVAVDEGADSFLARAPEGVELARLVGLGDELVAPATAQAALWSRGRLRALPSGTLLGVPADLPALARSDVLGERALARLQLDLVLPGRRVREDVAVGQLVGRRLGREVVERLVDPLLGGVYAGRADALSFEATVPTLAAAARSHRSLLLAARAARHAAQTTGPVFASLPGGLCRLVAAAATCSGAHVRTGTTVRGLRRTPTGWALETGSAAKPERLEADAVIVALPPAQAARLLAAEVPAAAADLDVIDSASVAVVTLALPVAAFPEPLSGSGYLVPAVEHRVTKAVTFSSRKWAHQGAAAPEVVLVRCSVGRHGEQLDLQRSDEELVRVVLAELREAIGVQGQPVDSRVTRWGGALPQYAVGHLARVVRVRAAVAGVPRLGVCGSAYDGVGLPAVIRSGQTAAAQVGTQLFRAGDLSA